jgi:hypothetical protein
MTPSLKLRTGATVPAIGFGTWQVSIDVDVIHSFIYLIFQRSTKVDIELVIVQPMIHKMMMCGCDKTK